MSRLGEVVGQPAAVGVLERLLASGRLPQAFVFHGPAEVGKHTTALGFAAALLCREAGATDCGRCPSCRLIEHGGHPDLVEVGREAKPDGAPGELRSQVVVGQVRRLAALAPLAPRLGPRRVFVIDPADRMNEEAQNALLKTLEEPPEGTVILLLAVRPHLLLPTVRSRCFEIGFALLDSPELASLLERRGLARGEALARAALAGGRLGRALTLDLPALRERRDELGRMLEGLSGRIPSAIAALPAMAAALSGKDEATLSEGLDLLEELLRDAARAGTGADSERRLLHADLAAGLEDIGARLGPARAAALVEAIERVRERLRVPLNRTIAAESILAAIAGGPLP